MKKLLFFLLLFIPINAFALEASVVDINELSIQELQYYVDKGYLTYEKITKLYLDRINEYDEYNAIITINENAIEQAKKLDEERINSGKRSLIHGLPVIVKDNIDVKGLPTTNGTKALLDSYPNENAEVVQKLIDAGAIIIAKANMDEFAFNALYSKSSFGYTYNAYNLDYSSYGSSGGSAVAVASNLAVFALGTDTGSSIRVPSSANGVIGIRPSYNIISSDGVIKFEETRDVVGVITKYVSDNAIVLDIIDNVDIDYTQNINKSLDGIRIGVVKSFMNPNTNSTSVTVGKTDKFVYNLMNKAIEELESLGAEIVYLDNFYLSYSFDASSLCYNFNNYIKNTSSKIKSLSDLIKNGGYTQYIDSYNYNCDLDYKKTSSYKNYMNIRNNNIKLANQKFDNNKLDAMIYPTIKTELAKISELKTHKLYTPSSSTAPLIGFPALSIPIGYYNNLPYGMEILAKENNESIIYQIASSYESVNNYYKTPDIAPSLYSISENTSILLKKYDEYKNNKDFEEANNLVLELFDNYDENKVNELILKYESIEHNINEKDESLNINYYIIILSTISFIILLLIIKKVKK